MKTQQKIESLTNATYALLKEKYRRDSFYWLCNIVRTFDEHDSETPIKPFPIRPYVETIVRAFRSKEKVLLLAKSRQMTISWLFTALATHEAQFVQYRKEIFFSKKEDDAFEMVERCKFIYSNQPKWLRNLCPLERKLKDMPRGKLFFANGSKIIGAPQGGDQVRSHVPTTAFLDEIAFQTEAEDTYASCLPCAQKIVAFSSANAGFFGRITGLQK